NDHHINNTRKYASHQSPPLLSDYPGPGSETKQLFNADRILQADNADHSHPNAVRTDRSTRLSAGRLLSAAPRLGCAKHMQRFRPPE
ncbi:hypothetical protein TYRP_020369, partial [Tyrophagus putrescentiae]